MNDVSTKRKYDAILVAGQGQSSYKVYHQHKAFLKINGKCIINYVVECLQQVESIKEIYIVGLEDRLRQTLEEAQVDFQSPKRIHIVPQRSNLYLNVWHTFLQTIDLDEDSPKLMHPENRDRAVLVVPCDSPLITPIEVEYFISHCDVENYDHILGLTAEKSLEHFYPKDNKPGIKMAYLHLQEKSFRLNNLHLVKPIRIENRHYIQRMYEYRYQRNIKNFILFGLSLIGKDKTQHYRYYIGLQLGLLFASLGWNKLIDVIRVFDIPRDKSIGRELILLKVNVTTQTRPEIMQIVDIFRGRIIDVSEGEMTIELTGDEQKVEGIQKLLEKFGIKELVRTGQSSVSTVINSSGLIARTTLPAHKPVSTGIYIIRSASGKFFLAIP